ncbi:major facilitator superfamily domain-containing protein [Kockovaella imperatae]|uniref:Major facilitator superfamily domain-containing protein n=1 Tax=Kockovaella imperatae TaxID=4999 RepID=A0A1Y1ULD4_9TREE|nr:major facilitator superfamily domain-containing protein [Kockovaella imperatae]ORX38296.1 major facilitator superfamily domain-containing protein [Kockovaella imperatae]
MSQPQLPRKHSTGVASETATVVDLQAVNDGKSKAASTFSTSPNQSPQTQHSDTMPPSTFPELRLTVSGSLAPMANLVKTRTGGGAEPVLPPASEVKLSQRHKWSLLGVFSLSLFIDIWSYSAFFIFTDPISVDLDVKFEEQSWVITAYAVTFAAFLLFWGRVSDLYSAKPVFAYGFIALGVLDLIISFLPDRYSFFVLRALSGVAGSCLIPASYRLIVAVFEPHELGKAFTLFGMSGALANVTGILVAGFIEYIPTHGQGAPWRWFFRLLAFLILPFAVGSLFFIPKPTGAQADAGEKWKRLDLNGSFSMLFGIVLLILGLTFGASYGFKTAKFLVPFLLAWPLFIFFFIWEARLPSEYAILPPAFWKIPNVAVLIVFALYVYGWWAVNFLALVETYTKVGGEKAIIAAVRLLPEGIMAGVVSIIGAVYPKLVSRPRWPITIGMVLALVGYALFAQGATGTDYWRYIFPGGLLGSAGMMVVFNGVNVGVITAVPAETSGVAGAMLQVAFQVGSAVSLSVQSGLFTINPGSIANYKNVQASFYWQIGFGFLWLVMFLVFYRPSKNVTSSDQDGAEQGGSERKVVAAH